MDQHHEQRADHRYQRLHGRCRYGERERDVTRSLAACNGTPVLGSGTIALSLSGLTLTRTYSTAVAGATETVLHFSARRSWAIYVYGAGGSGSSVGGSFAQGSAGGGGYCVSTGVAVTGGQTFTYTVGAAAAGVTNSNGNNGGSSSVTGTGVSITAGGGQAGLTLSASGRGRSCFWR